MLRRLLGDAAIYTMANVLSRAVSFVLLPLYARILHPSEIGLLDLVMVVGAVLNIFLPLEISLAFARFSADAVPGSIERHRIASTAWISLLATSTIGFIVLATLPFERWAKPETINPLIRIKPLALILWVLIILQYMVQNHLRWEGKARVYGFLGVITATSTVCLGYWLVLGLDLGMQGALLAMIGGILISLFPGAWFIRSSLSARPSRKIWRKMMIFSLPLWVGNILLVLSQYMDRFLITSILGLDELGGYSISARLASVVAIALTGIQMAIVPIVFSEHHEQKTQNMLQQSIILFALASAAVITILGCLAPEIVILVASHRYMHIAPLLPVQALSMVVFGAYIFFPGLWIDKNTKYIALVNVIYGVSMLVFSSIGALLWGIMGVAVGNLCASFIYLGLTVRMSQPRYPVTFNLTPLLVAAGVVAFVLILVFGGGSLLFRVIVLAVLTLILIGMGWHYLRGNMQLIRTR